MAIVGEHPIVKGRNYFIIACVSDKKRTFADNKK